MDHHQLPDQTPGVLSLILTAIVSIWTSLAMEVVHGVITLVFALTTCTAVFFLQRYLKKRFKEK